MFLPAFSFDFNPRSPCGERLYHFRILALHTTFQSTLPVWGATFVSFLYLLCEIISIHAPRVGSDRDSMRRFPHPSHFNPRSPCGERPSLSGSVVPLFLFQSTLPVWGATAEISKDIPEKSNITYTYCTKAKMIDSIYLLFLLCILSYSTKIRCEHH